MAALRVVRMTAFDLHYWTPAAGTAFRNASNERHALFRAAEMLGEVPRIGEIQVNVVC